LCRYDRRGPRFAGQVWLPNNSLPTVQAAAFVCGQRFGRNRLFRAASRMVLITKPPTARSKGGTTLADVAQLAGVSAMTVSRVMNGDRKVTEETRAIVRRAVRQLDYAPNLAARKLASGAVTHIGLLYSNPSSAYLSQILLGALDAARLLGCQLQVEQCEAEGAGESADVLDRFAESGIEGIILLPPLSESAAILAHLKSIEVTAATIATHPRGGNPLNVRIDDFRAAEEMTSYLLRLGHRNIGFIKGHANQVASRDRLHGFAAALAGFGVNAERLPVAAGDFTYRSGLAAAELLLTDPRPPTAIFASNDDMAAAALSVAHRRGMAVPRDLSVVGFDDTSLATTVWPELTTVRQPIAQMAHTAVTLLFEGIRSAKAAREIRIVDRVLDHSIIVRESSSAPTRW
jgi:LacI family transcriptional regulator